jgi:hypothetical protein
MIKLRRLLVKEEFNMDPRLKREVEQFVKGLIVKGVFSSYHRAATGGDMNPKDFEEDLVHAIASAIAKWTETVNNRDNWENQPLSRMIK